MKLKPCGDRLIVREIKVGETTTESGIVLTNSTPESDPIIKAEVLAVGAGLAASHCPANVGDTILVPRFGGQELRAPHTGGEVLRLYKFEEVYAVIDSSRPMIMPSPRRMRP